MTPSLSINGTDNVSEDTKQLTEGKDAACTEACTNEAKNGPNLTFEALIVALLSLTAEDRAKLTRWLLDHQ